MASSSSSNPNAVSARTPNVPPLLLCEALGFSPQLLLDDIINIANNAVQDGVNGMEEFLNKWADERMALEAANLKTGSRTTSTVNADADATTHEVEQGLVAFQTLLEYHTDIAFDFFEAWCLRNIFMIPPDLPVVLPHQAGLDLTATPEKEQELMDEVEELRKQLDAHRKLKRVLQRAVRTSARQRQHAEARLASLTSLSPLPSAPNPAEDPLHTLPARILDMYTTLSSLPPLDVPARAPGAQADPGKRQWETSRTGYLNWAVGRLVERAEVTDASGAGAAPMAADESGGDGPPGSGAGKAAVDAAEASTVYVGTSAELQRALAAVEAVGAVRRDLEGVRSPASKAQSQSQSQNSSQPPSEAQGQSGARRQSQGSSQTTGQRRQSQLGQRRQSLIPSQNRRREADRSREVDTDGDVPMEE